VISFDRGGPRDGTGDTEAYLQTVRQNLRLFGVDGFVDLIVGEVSRTVSAVPKDARISVLMLDADGSIDRDIGHFIGRVIPGGAIIIDDCADLVRLKRVSMTTVRVDSKMRLAYLLLSYFKSKGIISEGTQIKYTYFGEKLRGPPDGMLDLNEVVEIYRKLVFTSAAFSPLHTARRMAIRLLQRVSPTFTQRLRVLYRRNVSETPHQHQPGG
jgi:hypothetical protein